MLNKLSHNRIAIPAGFKSIVGALTRCDRSSINRLQKQLQRIFNCNDIQIFSAGRYALYQALRQLPASKKEVITPAFGCDIVPATIIAAGKIPVLADIDSTYFSIDGKDVIAKLSASTAAVIAVHEFGNPCLVNEWNKIRENRITIVEDAAIALGATYPDGRGIGQTDNPLVLSAGVGKPISSWSAGALINIARSSADKTIVSRRGNLNAIKLSALVALGNEYILPRFISLLEKLSSDDSSNFNMDDVNTPPTMFDSELWLDILKCLDEEFYRRLNGGNAILSTLQSFGFQTMQPNGNPMYGRIPFYVPEDAGREKLIKQLRMHGIDATIPARINLIKRTGVVRQGDYPNAERAYRQLVTITINSRNNTDDLCEKLVRTFN